MQAALSGYLAIWSVIGVGWVVAHFGVLTEPHRRMLTRVAFVIASPALLFRLVAQADLTHLFNRTLLVSIAAILVAGSSYLLLIRLWRGRDALPARVIGTLCAAYTNSANLGLPIAAYVLGDMTWMAPIILLQVGLMQPTALALLDLDAARASGQRLTWWRYALLPFRNPITVATLAGLVFNAAGASLPEVVWEPIDMIGAVAVPAMLLAFGVSLRLDPLPGRGPQAVELGLATVIKVLWQPLVAFALGTWIGLARTELLAVVVLAALPTAQNIYLIAGRYRVRTLLARDAIFISTLASIPVITAASSWLR